MKCQNRNLPDPGTSVKVVSMKYTILTEGPLANRPCFKITLGKKGKKIKIKKLCKKILASSAVRFVVVEGKGSMNTDLTTAIIRIGLYVQIDTDGRSCPVDFPFIQNSVFVTVIVSSSNIHSELKTKAMAFRYTINLNTEIAKDGLPAKLYRPADTLRTILSPEVTSDKKETVRNIKRIVNISKYYGYYISVPYEKLIGIE